ncbi:MAG TPA: hypothetical protein VGO50_07745 [Pyrinomonadaceae bacterium]|jgi:hypothetical protein|nr:hypothetical protein [Pyrinomonadaceae bacterium]
MYCAKCGSLVQNTLNYCNSCGNKLAKTDERPARQGNPLPFLAAALCVIDTVGLFVLALLTLMFLDRHVDEKVMMIICTIYLLSLASINFMFLRMISKLVSSHIENKSSSTEKPQASLFSHTTAQLEAPQQPIQAVQPLSSVTEHTTRTLDEVLIKER